MAETVTSSYLVCGAEVLTPAGWQEFDLNLVDGAISDRTVRGAEVVDATGLRIVPGFIDMQINGGWGLDLQASPSSLWALGDRLVEHGVTTFLPTLTTNGADRYLEALAVWRARPDRYRGAEPIGWHLEGPWLAPSRHGAHDRDLLRPIPREVPPELHPGGGVRLVTLAPELANAKEMIATLNQRGVVVSCGHTEATSAQTIEAIRTGATMATHLFNAMPSLHHRTFGAAGALLLYSPFLGLIADGVHVAPEMVKLAWAMAAGRIIIVSDAVWQMQTELDNGGGGARTGDGTLAGATIGLDQAVRNLMWFTGCELTQAVQAVTEVPAYCLRLQDRGRIEKSRRADLAALDGDGVVRLTFVGGQLVWDAR